MLMFNAKERKGPRGPAQAWHRKELPPEFVARTIDGHIHQGLGLASNSFKAPHSSGISHEKYQSKTSRPDSWQPIR
jgi:hypothetical protein